MEFKKIEEGMTATQVAELLDENFNNIAKEIEKNIGENNVPIATENRVGGITAKERTGFEQNEVVIDPETGRLYTKGVTVDGEFVPDEEDLTAVAEVDRVVARFKDRDTTKGKGYIILRTVKPIVEQMKQENTIYEIRYDFDLNEETLEIPANSVLDFRGGSFNNGHIVFNDTKIIGVGNFNCRYEGTIANNEIQLEWFNGDDYNIIQDAINCIKHYSLEDVLSSGVSQKLVMKSNYHYKISEELVFGQYFRVEGNECIIEQTQSGKAIFSSTNAFHIDVSNISFKGVNVKAFYVDSPNYDRANFKFTALSVDTDNYDVSMVNNWAFYIKSRSCTVNFNEIRCNEAPQFLRCSADFVFIRNSWINGYSYSTGFLKPENSCSINNSGTQKTVIDKCVFIPEWNGYTPNKDTRWIDNYGFLSIQDSHFGGENAGIPIIWQYVKPETLNMTNDSLCQIDISNTQCAGGAYYKYWGGVIVLMKDVMPGYFSIKNTNVDSDTRLISLYGWVKDNSELKFENVNDVYNAAKDIFIQALNSFIFDKRSYFPNNRIYVNGNTTWSDKALQVFSAGNDSIRITDLVMNTNVRFARIYRGSYDFESYNYSEFTFRVVLSGAYKTLHIFSKCFTARVKCHFWAANQPRVTVEVDDESEWSEWPETTDEQGVTTGTPTSQINLSVVATPLDIFAIDLAFKVDTGDTLGTDWPFTGCSATLVSTVHSTGSKSNLPGLYFKSCV